MGVDVLVPGAHESTTNTTKSKPKAKLEPNCVPFCCQTTMQGAKTRKKTSDASRRPTPRVLQSQTKNEHRSHRQCHLKRNYCARSSRAAPAATTRRRQPSIALVSRGFLDQRQTQDLEVDTVWGTSFFDRVNSSTRVCCWLVGARVSATPTIMHHKPEMPCTSPLR